VNNSSIIVLAKNSVSRDRNIKVIVLPQGMEPAPWAVYTVMQVEEVKILIRMLPI